MTKKQIFNFSEEDRRLSEEGLHSNYISQYETEYGPLTDEIKKALLERKGINAS